MSSEMPLSWARFMPLSEESEIPLSPFSSEMPLSCGLSSEMPLSPTREMPLSIPLSSRTEPSSGVKSIVSSAPDFADLSFPESGFTPLPPLSLPESGLTGISVLLARPTSFTSLSESLLPPNLDPVAAISPLSRGVSRTSETERSSEPDFSPWTSFTSLSLLSRADFWLPARRTSLSESGRSGTSELPGAL